MARLQLPMRLGNCMRLRPKTTARLQSRAQLAAWATAQQRARLTAGHRAHPVLL
jgi:hypothetical protein